jgi:hypothetical protein
MVTLTNGLSAGQRLLFGHVVQRIVHETELEVPDRQSEPIFGMKFDWLSVVLGHALIKRRHL